MELESIKFRRGIRYTLAFVALLWTVKAFELSFAQDFGAYGIFPRTLVGSIGIITGPLVHGDVFHLISNTFPMIVLGIGIFYFYPKKALSVFLLIYLMSGFWVWIAAREAYHIGASGIVYGLIAFLFIGGFINRDRTSLAVSMVIIFLYGGNMMYGIIPTDSNISWESHLTGSLAGVFCAFYFRKPIAQIAVDEKFDNLVTRYRYLEKKDSEKEEDEKKYTMTINGNSDYFQTPDF